MKVDLCDIRRMLRADFFAKDRDVTLQTSRSVYIEGGGEIVVPIGGIILWSGAIVDIPTGWQICNGTNGTPDLRDKIPIGAGDTYAVDATGGATTHTHDDGSYAAANDTHGHDVAGTAGGGSDHTHGPGTLATSPGTLDDGAVHDDPGLAFSTKSHTHTVTSGVTAIETSHTHPAGSYAASNDTHGHDVTGTSAAGSSLPPYHALAYIMRLT